MQIKNLESLIIKTLGSATEISAAVDAHQSRSGAPKASKLTANDSHPIMKNNATTTDGCIEYDVASGHFGTAQTKNTMKEARAVKHVVPAESVSVSYDRNNELNSIEAFKRTLVKDKDYGSLPGVNGAVLFKKGALRFLKFMNFRKTEELVDKTVNFSGENVFLSYTVRVVIINADGEIITEALGSCNSAESKYEKKGASADNVLVSMASKRALVLAVKELLLQ